MLRRLSPVEFVRPMGSGRTRPLLVACDTLTGETIDVVTKFSSGCDEGVLNLAREMVASCLAGDLGLPIPEPFLINVVPEWVSIIADPELRLRISASAPVAFGSKHLAGQYAAWSQGNRILDPMVPAASTIFVFDAITQNADRRSDNPNCLVKGDDLRVFDHEMCFTHGLVIGWKPPWVLGGLNALETPGFHIFREQLRKREIDFGPIRVAWSDLSDERLAAYGANVPIEWAAANAAVERALALVREARDNFDACLMEIKRILG